MKHLIIGMGEVGKALDHILSEKYNDVFDLDSNEGPRFAADWLKVDVIHVCFPYSDRFVEFVTGYMEQYLSPSGLCIIHSTVPLGTSDLCYAVHSPIRGQHPNLERGIRTFTKYFGGMRCTEACNIFESCGIDTIGVQSARTTEALKLWDTAQYAWNIILEKEIHRWCEENKVDFEIVYTHANHTYNDGYKMLGRKAMWDPKFLKYVLDHVPGPIGGHCVIQNALLLDAWIAEMIESRNQEYKKELK